MHTFHLSCRFKGLLRCFTVKADGPFPSYLVPLFRHFSYEEEFDLHENEPVGGTQF